MAGSSRNLWLGIVAAVLLLLAGYRLIYGGGKEQIEFPQTATAVGVCLHCDAESLFTYKVKERAPYECPACGESALFKWWYCEECRYRFVPELVRKPGEPPRPTPFPVCTHCGCNAVSGWSRENPYQVPEGDAELPRWP